MLFAFYIMGTLVLGVFAAVAALTNEGGNTPSEKRTAAILALTCWLWPLYAVVGFFYFLYRLMRTAVTGK